MRVVSAVAVIVLAACADPAPRGAGAPSADSGAEGSAGDGTEGTDGTTSETDSGWPGGTVGWDASVSLVHDGVVVSDGAVVAVETAPAGLSQPTTLSFVVTNRTDAPLALSADPGDWLTGEGWSLASSPPTALEPEASAVVSAVFSPELTLSAGTFTASLTVPSPSPVSVALQAQVPRALRALLVGTGGLTLVSDDYGATFVEVLPDDGGGSEPRGVAWGDGRFFRADRAGDSWFDPGTYAWSTDGEAWTTSTYADAFWPSACGYGLGRFVCARDASITWSASGETVIHEAGSYDDLLNDMDWTGAAFVAVGRSGRRALSLDGTSWTNADDLSTGDFLNGVAHGGGALVAVGGNDRIVVTASADSGVTWTDQILCEDRYARLEQVAYNDATGVFLATGEANGCARHWRSADGGLTWEPVTSSHNVTVLGVLNGQFVARTNQWGQPVTVVVSADGETWTERITLADGQWVSAMTVEDR